MKQKKLSEEQLAKLRTHFNKIIKKIATGKSTYANAEFMLSQLANGELFFSMSHRIRGEILELMSLSGHESLSELNEHAFGVYKTVIEGIVNGGIFAIYNQQEGEITQLVTPTLQRLEEEVRIDDK